MKVVYPFSQNKGGLPHYGAELANAVAHHADVTVMKQEETTADDLFSDDVEVVDAFSSMDLSWVDLTNLDLSLRENLSAMYSYRNLAAIEELNPDVVHDVMGLLPHMKLFTATTGFHERYPFVVTFHELTANRFPLSNPPMLVSHLIKSFIPDPEIDVGITHTEDQRSILRRSRHNPTETEVVPHGTYDFFTGYDYEERPEEEHSVLFFGNVLRDKGIDTLIESIPVVKREIPDVNLLIAGDGQLSDRLQRIVETHPENFEIHDRFVPNDEVGEFFSRASLVAVPYRKRGRGHSGALSTAYAFGKPVVASDAGEFPRMVEDAGCGVVVPADDPNALAEGIVELLTDTARRQRMAENSARMADRLSWKNIANRHMDIYERAVELHRGRELSTKARS